MIEFSTGREVELVTELKVVTQFRGCWPRWLASPTARAVKRSPTTTTCVAKNTAQNFGNTGRHNDLNTLREGPSFKALQSDAYPRAELILLRNILRTSICWATLSTPMVDTSLRFDRLPKLIGNWGKIFFLIIQYMNQWLSASLQELSFKYHLSWIKRRRQMRFRNINII